MSISELISTRRQALMVLMRFRTHEDVRLPAAGFGVTHVTGYRYTGSALSRRVPHTGLQIPFRIECLPVYDLPDGRRCACQLQPVWALRS